MLARNPVSLNSFIAWLETKDPNKQYDFMDMSGACLIGQYMAASDIPWDWNSSPSNFRKTAIAIFDGKPLDVVSDVPWTVGAALERARTALNKQ